MYLQQIFMGGNFAAQIICKHFDTLPPPLPRYVDVQYNDPSSVPNYFIPNHDPVLYRRLYTMCNCAEILFMEHFQLDKSYT